ncbi:MAG: gamma-glutamyl-gamma-aminobutyrate hydrolase family protein [Spirochaetaceae bacterium]|nr:MAG: gamma-glutamyl-gamma-aminobutyrate hydrolase family protein [Spirochaetaceae bacterium]
MRSSSSSSSTIRGLYCCRFTPYTTTSANSTLPFRHDLRYHFATRITLHDQRLHDRFARLTAARQTPILRGGGGVATTTTLPIIGIPCRNDRSVKYNGTAIYGQSVAYTKAIVQAGGVPFLIPLDLPEPSLRHLYDMTSGILLAGGGDIDPAVYGGAGHATIRDVEPNRDRAEITITRWAVADGRPLLGVCRGIQVIAVAAGGTLIEDIPSEVPDALPHKRPTGADREAGETGIVQLVRLTESSRLADIVGEEAISVNSIHHQAVRAVPAPFEIVGRSADGLAEAIEHRGHPFLVGVQWHPEQLVGSDESARRIFRAFVLACGDATVTVAPR